MPDKKDEKLPNQSIPAADIPNLKKQDQDRKKSGAAWGSAKPAGTPFAGARGAVSGAGSVGAVGGGSSGGIGTLLANLVARFQTILAPLLGSVLGKAVAMAIAALVVGGLATVAFRMMSSTGTPSSGSPELGALSSSIKVARDTSDNRLEYAANSAKGKLDWANKPIAPEDVKADEAGDAAKNAEAQAQAEAPNPAEMAQNMMPEGAMPPGAGQSGSMGNRFGSHDIFGGRSGFGSGGSGGKSVVPNYASKSGAGNKFAQGPAKAGSGGTVGSRRAMGSSRFSLRGLKSSRALAQLRGMGPMNSQIRSGSRVTEYNAVQAQAQFEGNDLVGASAPVSPTDTDPGTGTGTGSGTGSGTGTGTGSYTPTIEQCGQDGFWNGSACQYTGVNGNNATPWQSDVDDAKSMVNAAMIMLIIAGVIAVIAAYWKNSCCSWVGWVLFAIALICGIGAIVCASKVISDGEKINSKGGAPLGDTYKTMGWMLVVGGIASIIATFWAQFNLAQGLTTAVMLLLPALMGVLASLMQPPEIDMPETPTTITCPEGQQPINSSDPDSGCQPIPSDNSTQ